MPVQELFILAYIYIYIHTPYCGGDCLVVRDAVYSGSTKYSMKLADYIFSIKDLMFIGPSIIVIVEE